MDILQSARQSKPTESEAGGRKKSTSELLRSLLTDLAEVGTAINQDLRAPELSNMGEIEEKLSATRLFVSKIKSEVQNLVSNSSLLEREQVKALQKVEVMEKELGDCRLTLVQHEAKIKTLNDLFKESDAKKQSLEAALDGLNKSMTQQQQLLLKVVERTIVVEKQLKEVVEEQLPRHTEHHDRFRFRAFLTGPKYADVLLKCGSRIFPCHRIVLGSR